MVLTTILASILALAICIVTYIHWSLRYWKKKNVPYIEPSFPFGNIDNPFTTDRHIGIQFKNIYQGLRDRTLKYGGAYGFAVPVFMPIDPQLIKNLLQQDFQHFVDKGFYYNERDDPVSANLFTLGGDRWRPLRSKLSSAFTPGKIKTMFDIMLQCGDQMQNALAGFYKKKQPIDIKDLSSCYTLDNIGSCCFGIECNSFKYPDAEFRRNSKLIFKHKNPLESFLVAFAFAFPNAGRFLRLRLFKKETTEFFMRVVMDTVKARDTQKIVRNDMVQLLLDLGNPPDGSNLDNGEGLTLKELAAQAFIFFAAGFETSATTMTFCLYELASNPYIQQKVRDELREVLAKNEGKFTYEAIMNLQYMGQAVNETLRKYPPVPLITRCCVKDYTVPNTDVVISKGDCCLISILGLHRDPSYYPDPEKFDPERFSAENKEKIPPFTYIPFGEGPRICIGLRLGTLQTKVGLAMLLRNYSFTLNKKTILPIQVGVHTFPMMPKSEIFLDIEKVNM